MKDLNKDQHDFEEGLQKAFDEAELEPSEEVWLKVDNALANQESAVFKRKIVYYKYAAAISMVLLFSLGVYTYQNYIQHVSDSADIALVEKQEAIVLENTTREGQTEDGDIDTKNNGSEKEELLNHQNIAALEKGGKTDPVGDSEGDVSGELERENRNSKATARISDTEELHTQKNTEIARKETDKNSFKPGDFTPAPPVSIAKSEGRSADSSINGAPTEPSENLKNGLSGERENGVVKNGKDSFKKGKDHMNPSVVMEDEKRRSGSIITYEETGNQIPEGLVARERRENLKTVDIKGGKVLETPEKQLNIEIYRVPDLLAAKPLKKSSGDFYAGVNVTPQFFDPNIQMNTGGMANATMKSNFQSMGVNPVSEEQNIQPQISYAYGFNLGMKVGKRWVLHSGLQYAKNTSTGSTSSYIQSTSSNRYLAVPATFAADNAAESRSDFSSAAFSPIYNTPQTHHYNENFEFASIPMKAGFILVDKKISIVLSTGIATDLFLRNDIEDQQNNYDKVTIKPGDSSPYRSVYFNGLAGSEIIYKLGDRYSFSLEPSYRIALSAFSKSSSLITSHPQSFGVAAGVRYIFKK